MNNTQGDTKKYNEPSQPKTPKHSTRLNIPSVIPFSEKTLSDEVFLQYLHDSPPINRLFVFIQCFGLSYLFDVGIFVLRNLLV